MINHNGPHFWTNRKCSTNYGMSFINPSKAYPGRMRECISCKSSLIIIIIQIVYSSPATKHELLEHESHVRVHQCEWPVIWKRTSFLQRADSGCAGGCLHGRVRRTLGVTSNKGTPCFYFLFQHIGLWYSYVPSIESYLKRRSNILCDITPRRALKSTDISHEHIASIFRVE
jgi:hypothetical protein